MVVLKSCARSADGTLSPKQCEQKDGTSETTLVYANHVSLGKRKLFEEVPIPLKSCGDKAREESFAQCFFGTGWMANLVRTA